MPSVALAAVAESESAAIEGVGIGIESVRPDTTQLAAEEGQPIMGVPSVGVQDFAPRMDAPQPDGQGAIASELKGLNAAHASAQAMDQAAPYSRVGQIATYQKTMFASERLRAAADDRASEVAALIEGYEGLTTAEIDVALAETLERLGVAIEAGDTEGATAANQMIAALETARPEAAAFEIALAAAKEAADAARLHAEEATLAQRDLLRELTRGEEMSPGALAYFHALLAGTNIMDREA